MHHERSFSKGKLDVLNIVIITSVIVIIGLVIFIILDTLGDKGIINFFHSIQSSTASPATVLKAPPVSVNTERSPLAPPPLTTETKPTGQQKTEVLLQVAEVTQVYDTAFAVSPSASSSSGKSVKADVSLDPTDPSLSVKNYIQGNSLLIPKTIFPNFDIKPLDIIRIYGYQDDVNENTVTRLELLQ